MPASTTCAVHQPASTRSRGPGVLVKSLRSRGVLASGRASTSNLRDPAGPHEIMRL